MDIMKPAAVIGTNAWGGKLYGKAMRGSYVEDEVIRNAMKTAKEQDICIYDLARDYGLGKAEKMIGELAGHISYKNDRRQGRMLRAKQERLKRVASAERQDAEGREKEY